MVQSINTKVDLVAESTSYMGLGQYGKVMIGDRGFEFYDDSNPRNYIQIPWEEVDVVIASLMFGGKWIPRYAISTKKWYLQIFLPPSKGSSAGYPSVY
ncbi:hypothetical protein Q757_01375 [Oenococcus alcoholitolerans]|uniref:DUF956 family protein n=1 Tax=Oenococcus alcoholitolerans TaxID=931074 RepID=A0ABR4XTI6_9LACO|nr:hypothetical protein Q757_01375 [Oenococcus alcoholitolerans]